MNLRNKCNNKLIRLRQECDVLIMNLVSDPVFPSEIATARYWDARISSSTPRSIHYVYNIKTGHCTKKKGFELIGMKDTDDVDYQKLSRLYHKDHKLVTIYEYLNIHKLLLNYQYKNNPQYLDIYYSSRRAFTDQRGKNWNSWYLSNPFQFDKNGNVVSYIAKLSLLSEYRGESLTSEFFYEGQINEIKALVTELNKNLQLQKNRTLEFLNFTQKQSEILLFLAGGCSNETIAKEVGKSISNINQHNQRILTIARELFPDKYFENAKEVGFYFRQMGLT